MSVYDDYEAVGAYKVCVLIALDRLLAPHDWYDGGRAYLMDLIRERDGVPPEAFPHIAECAHVHQFNNFSIAHTQGSTHLRICDNETDEVFHIDPATLCMMTYETIAKEGKPAVGHALCCSIDILLDFSLSSDFVITSCILRLRDLVRVRHIVR